MRRVVLIALACVLPAVVSAQSSQYALKIYAKGASAPQQTIVLTDFICGRDPSPSTASNINPTKTEWDDPSTPGKVCTYADAGGLLLSRPIGEYEGTLTLQTPDGVSPESARGPFIVARTAAPTGLRFIR